jgi:hypothetical protein
MHTEADEKNLSSIFLKKVYAIFQDNTEENDRIIRENEEAREKTNRAIDQMFKKKAEAWEVTNRSIDRIFKKNEETRKKTDYINKENEETSKEADKKSQKTGRSMKKPSKRMGNLSHEFGEMPEHLLVSNIHKRFNEMGHSFTAVSPGGYKIYDLQNYKVRAEIDILFENDDTIMAVEVNDKPGLNDVEHHISRIEILREYRKKMGDKREIQGAIAGGILGSKEKEAALAAGFYVLEQSEDTISK